MSEETFVKELERRADDVRPVHLRFEDVRTSAHRIRRRRQIAASAAAAAVVAVVLLAPGLVGGSPRSEGPEPAPPAPRTTVDHRVLFDLDAPMGDAPRVLYQRAADSVAIDADGDHDLPSGTAQVVPYEDGYVAVAPGDSPLEVPQRLYRLDGDFKVIDDLGPVVGPVTFTADGDRIAWAEIAEDRTATVVSHDGTEVVRATLPAGQLPHLIGFTADGTVYSLDDGNQDLGDWVMDGEARSTKLEGFQHIWDASPTGDLVVGMTRYDNSEDRACAGALRDGAPLWSDKCWYQLEDVSPDGSLVFGYPDVPTPNHAKLTVLDAETGEPVVRFAGGHGAQVLEAAWEDDGHVLAVVYQGGRQAILRLGLDGTVERTTAPVEEGVMDTTWFLAGRPFE